MSYIGQAALKNSELKRFDVTSSTSATHVLSWTAPNEQSLWITINGVKQQDDAYSIAGIPTTITLTDALVATDKMEVIGILDIGEITIVGDNTISTAKIAPDAVTAAEIATDAVGTSEIAANAVDTSEIAANAVTLTELADGTQGGTLYYGAAGAPTELAAGTSGYFLKTLGAAANPVWGVPTEFNDTAILNDIATLALHSATQNNQTAFNLTNAFVDQYEDSTGIDTTSNVGRVSSGEYMSSIYGSTIDANTLVLLHMDGLNAGTTFTDSSPVPLTVSVNNTTTTTSEKKFGTAGADATTTGSYLSVPATASLNFAADASFTFDFWCKIPSAGATLNNRFFQKFRCYYYNELSNFFFNFFIFMHFKLLIFFNIK